MTERLSDTALVAWRAFLGSYAAVRGQLEREMTDQGGIPFAWYEVLLRLAESPEGYMRMQHLAEDVFLSKSGLSQAASRMEAAGLIKRELCPSDRRGVNAVITPAGRATLRKAAGVHLRGINRHFASHLDASQLGELSRALGGILDAEAPRNPKRPGRAASALDLPDGSVVGQIPRSAPGYTPATTATTATKAPAATTTKAAATAKAAAAAATRGAARGPRPGRW